jgi:LysR family glycine cleavage system transcriptional activator
MRRRRLPSLNALRAFEAAGRHGSFSSAAEELFVTHASISRHVRHLEDWLGRTLFERHSRGVSLNEAGEHYLGRLTKIFDDLDSATQETRATGEESELAISVEVTFAMRWLVPRLGDFHACHPDIELNLDPDDDCIDLRREAFDLAIRSGEGGWPGVKSEMLVWIEAFPVCSPEFLKDKNIATPKDLLAYPLLHEDSKQWWREWLEAAGVEAPGRPRGHLFQSAHLTLEAAEAGQGFALGDNISAAEALKEGWLVKPLNFTMPMGAYWLLTAEDSLHSPAAEAFRAWIMAEIRAFRPC